MTLVEEPTTTSYRFHSGTVVGSHASFGIGEGWAAPVAIFEAPGGFNEEAWLDAAPCTVIATRLKGAAVTWLCGKHAGRTNTATGGASVMQCKGGPNHSSAAGAIKFAQIYLHDSLIDRVADAIKPGAVASGALRDDLVFAPDRDLDRRIGAYIASATAGASALEVEADGILLLSYLLRTYHGFAPAKPMRGGLAPWQLRRACEAMMAQLDGDPGLDDLAAVVGCSPTHFSRAFKQSTGLAPFHWLAERRIEKAKTLLEDNRLPLAEVALAVGFSAQPQFTTAFGRVTGVTPGQWRRERLS